MKKLFISSFVICLLIESCKQNYRPQHFFNVRTDIRFGEKFFSICLNDEGKAYVIRGRGSNYIEPFIVKDSDTSEIIKSDSLKKLYNKVVESSATPNIDSANTTDAPRVEVYYKNKKIYDIYRWDERVWTLFRPITSVLPYKFNPFKKDEQPF